MKVFFIAGATGFEPAISALTGPHVSRYTTPPFAVSPVLLALWRVLPELNEQNFSTAGKNRQGILVLRLVFCGTVSYQVQSDLAKS